MNPNCSIHDQYKSAKKQLSKVSMWAKMKQLVDAENLDINRMNFFIWNFHTEKPDKNE